MRRTSPSWTRHLWTTLFAVGAAAVLGAGIAQGALTSTETPPAERLDRAVLAAARAPSVPGISARIEFVNELVPSGAGAPGSRRSPLLSGATGRLWLAGDRLRLELQSDRGDAQVVSDGRRVSIYDATGNVLYRLERALADGERRPPATPTLAQVRGGIDRLARAWELSGARTGTRAGHPSYTLRLEPKGGGLLGAAELAWDAERGVPLRAALYARGRPAPVLALQATRIYYGPIDPSVLTPSPPAGARIVQAGPPERRTGDFAPTAPAGLVGMRRRDVRRVSLDGRDGVLTSYGPRFGGLVVLERRAEPGTERAPNRALGTPLGTIVGFERAGVTYTVAGTVAPATARAAASALR